jgi:hypothetical protein
VSTHNKQLSWVFNINPGVSGKYLVSEKNEVGILDWNDELEVWMYPGLLIKLNDYRPECWIRIPEVVRDRTQDNINNLRAETIRNRREYLRKKLISAGLTYVGEGSPRGTLMRFITSDAKQNVNILCYISTSLSKSGQVSFAVNRLKDRSVHWIIMDAIPLTRTFLFKREELLSLTREGKDSMSMTIRAGTSSTNEFDNRLYEVFGTTGYRVSI